MVGQSLGGGTMNTFDEEARTCIAIISRYCIVITNFILHNIVSGSQYYRMFQGSITIASTSKFPKCAVLAGYKASCRQS
jgi:hypothetical protein